MSNPLHELFIQAEQPASQVSLMTNLGELQSRYKFLRELHDEEKRKYSKYRDLSTGRDVVLIHLKSSREEDIAKFKNEVEISSGLQHPGIVPHYDAGRDEEGLYLARKWIDEKSLFERNKDGVKIWSKDQTLRIILQICEALNYAHSQGVSHCNLKPEKIFISESGNVTVTDWSKAKAVDVNSQRSDIEAVGKFFCDISNLCRDFDKTPGSLMAIANKALRKNNSYSSINDIILDLQAYTEGYIPRAESGFLVKSALQIVKRNPLLCLLLTASAAIILTLSIWFFQNLNERQSAIDLNLIEAEKKREAADQALREFIKENEWKKKIAVQAAEAHAAVARIALGKGNLVKAQEMGSIAWNLSKNEKYTRETRAHLSFIEERYEEAQRIYESANVHYFDKMIELCKKYNNAHPDIKTLLADYEFSDRKELMHLSISRILFKKSPAELRRSLKEIIQYFNPDAQVKIDLKILDSSVELSLSGSRNVENLDFMIGMPVNVLDIRNSGVSEADLTKVPELKKVIFSEGQKVKAEKKVMRIER